MTLTPAYGRDYKSAKQVKADWDAGKDFVCVDMFGGNDGRYINKADAKGQSHVIRYDGLRKVVAVKG